MELSESRSDAAATGRTVRTVIIPFLLFFSGAAGLIYQILWMREIGTLFGNTVYAASATLAAFFAGLAAGSWFWGRRAGRSSNPLRMYSLLQWGVAATALIYFVLLHLFYWIYPLLHHVVSGAASMLAVKFLLSLLLVFPAAFCMGGTMPAVGQHVIRTRSTFGRTSALLYGANTLGAASGVVIAVFLLVPNLGFRLTYGVSLLLSTSVGCIAWRLSRSADEPCIEETAQPIAVAARGSMGSPATPSLAVPGRWLIGALCFFSGFAMLSLEVLWNRLFAQVHENSVYSFAVILTVVLVCLSIGAWISAQLSRLKAPAFLVLGVLMIGGGMMLAVGPSLFMLVTRGLQPLTSLEPWGRYVVRIFGMGFAALGPVVVVLGTVFPYLMKAMERGMAAPGRTLGRLFMLNTIGAFLGSLLCGFVFLPVFGMWRTLQVITACYLVIGVLLPFRWTPAGVACRGVAGLFLMLLFTSLDPGRLPVSGVLPGTETDVVLRTWESSDSTITVVELEDGGRAIRLNSGYTLGSTGAYREQVDQARIPLYVHPHTRSLFFLGMGTGITAGAALDKRFEHVERVVACDLSPAVVEAARTYIPRELTGGLFEDPRATVLVEDGRHYLRVTTDTFDMINADLFLPYRRGTGNLYSYDHYRFAAQRLSSEGVFVQWVPLFQVTEEEFGIIVRTFLEAFGQVTMWRNNFTPGREQVALIGQRHAVPLQPSASPVGGDVMIRALERLNWAAMTPEAVIPNPDTIKMFYCGNMTAARGLFDAYPINTDDRPLIEYRTPRTFREVAAEDEIIWFVGPKVADLVDRVLEVCPPAEDPMLQAFSAGRRRLVYAGAAFHRSMITKSLGMSSESQAHWQDFVREWRTAATAEP